MVILQQLNLGTCVPNIIHGQYNGTKFLRATLKLSQIITNSEIIANMDRFFYKYYGKVFRFDIHINLKFVDYEPGYIYDN